MSVASLKMEKVSCGVCGSSDAKTFASGKDFEYRTSPDEFAALRCGECGLVYLNPRPAAEDGTMIKSRTPASRQASTRSRTFAAVLAESGIRHKRTRPYRPQTNGKVCEDLSWCCVRSSLTPAKV